MFNNGANIEATDNEGLNKPLALAGHYGEWEAVELLLELGASIDGIHQALHTNTEEMVKYINQKFIENNLMIYNYIGYMQTSFVCKQFKDETLMEHLIGKIKSRKNSQIVYIIISRKQFSKRERYSDKYFGVYFQKEKCC